MKKIAITGAAGNLGGLLAQEFQHKDNIHLNLLIHKKDVGDNLKDKSNVSVFRVDLASPKTLDDALAGVDVVVHFAGVLFKANPEKFLPTTKTGSTK